MAGITALGTTYNLPNYTGILFQLTPADTPFFSAIGGLTGGGQSTDTEFEWEAFDLRSAGQNVALEGQDAPTDQNRVRAQIKNVTQIHQETVGVSYTKQAAVGRKAGLANEATNPIRSELDWQTEQMLKQMVRDVEWSFINGTYQLPVDNSTPRKTRGLLAAIATNVADVAAGVADKSGSAATTDIITLVAHGLNIGDSVVFKTLGTTVGVTVGTRYYVSPTNFTSGQFSVTTTRGSTTVVDITTAGTVTWAAYAPLTKAMVDDLLQTVYDNGGITESATATLLCGSAQRRKVTAAYTAAGYVTKELAGNVGGVTVDRINTDFGTLNIMLDRHMPQDTLAVVSLEMCRPVFLEIPSKGHFFQEPLAKTGAKDRNMIYGEVGLEYGNERAHGKLVNLQG
ncbi:MAG TPA: DUF5309 family protein [Jiangellaceae bacterium]